MKTWYGTDILERWSGKVSQRRRQFGDNLKEMKRWTCKS